MKRYVFLLCALAAATGVATANAQRGSVRVQGDLALGGLCNSYSGPAGTVQGQSTIDVAGRVGAKKFRAKADVRTNGLPAGTYTVELTECNGNVFPQPAVTLGTIQVGKKGNGNLTASTVLKAGDYALQIIVRYGGGGPNASIALATEPAILEFS